MSATIYRGDLAFIDLSYSRSNAGSIYGAASIRQHLAESLGYGLAPPLREMCIVPGAIRVVRFANGPCNGQHLETGTTPVLKRRRDAYGEDRSSLALV